MALKSIKWVDELPLGGKKVFCRVDFNVPLDDQQRVRDDTRIRASLPTIKHILQAGGRLVCGSHLGRPKGKPVPELRMEPVGARLAELLGPHHRVIVADEPTGDAVRKVAADLREGEVLLLENLRFHPGESKNDPAFAKELASLVDGYVNDAFGTAHRAHASTAGMIPFAAFKGGGFLMKREVEFLTRLLHIESSGRPYVALLGGAKVSDKVGVLENLVPRVNVLIIGGAMANTFLAAGGAQLGASMVEQESLEPARRIVAAAKQHQVELVLPVDLVAAESPEAGTGQVVPADRVPQSLMALDVGPKTREVIAEHLRRAKTIFWNGPLGVFENKAFAEGTLAAARAVAEAQALSVVGGGDSVSAVKKSGFADKVSHISTGGGASLEFVEGKTLPGLAALEA